MDERGKQLAERMLVFSLSVAAFCDRMATNWMRCHVAGQLFRSATGMAANYRAARRGRSRREFAAKLGNALEEADESQFWLEFSRRAKFAPAETTAPLYDEASQFSAILTASVRTSNRPPDQQGQS